MKNKAIYHVISTNEYTDIFGDRIEEKDVKAHGNIYRITKTSFGAIDEDGNEITPCGGRVTVAALDTEDETGINAIYRFFDNNYDYELFCDAETIYNTHPTTRAYIDITTWEDEDELERAYSLAHYCLCFLDELERKGA